MKITVIDKQDSGIMADFANALGTAVNGRFVHIPEGKGAGYISGFAWPDDLRMMIRHYHLDENITIEWINETMEEQENIIFQMNGVFPSLAKAGTLLSLEQSSILICKKAVSSIIEMPSDTRFQSVTIRASKSYLQQRFGHIDHPLVASVLGASKNLVIETGISPLIISSAGEMLQSPVPAVLESQYYYLKCEQLLCHIFATLMQREAVPVNRMHMDDIKAVYAVRSRLQLHLDQAPDIASLAEQAAMSEPKLRRLFKQTFGKGPFEYFQAMRMQEAARLLKDKQLTVSEVGYRMGFANLSHFARVFEQHIGSKPKRYSTASLP